MAMSGFPPLHRLRLDYNKQGGGTGMSVRTFRSGAATLASLLLAQVPAYAADTSSQEAGAQQQAQGLQEVTVTATRTGVTSAQSTPLALSVFSGATLQQSGVSNIKDLSVIAPDLTVAQQNVNGEIYIRGVGSNNVFNGSDPDVTVQLDGVYLAGAFAQFMDFLDVDRVEVLRGPQGTLYGRNAVGGTVNIVSSTPADTPQGTLQLTGGNYGLFQGQFYQTGPIVPGTAQFSVAGNYITHGDYVSNATPGVPGVENANHGGLRAQLRLEPAADTVATTRFDWSHADERSDSFDHNLAPVPFAPIANSLIWNYTTVAINSPQTDDLTLWGIAEEIDSRLSDHIDLKSLTAYRSAQYQIDVDPDATELQILNSVQADSYHQVSQELDLTARAGPLEAFAGLLYYSEHEVGYITSAALPSLLVPPAGAVNNVVLPHSDIQSTAGFGQATYHLSEALSVIAGIRYTAEQRKFAQNFTQYSLNPAMLNDVTFQFIGNSDRTYDAATPKFGVNYSLAPNVLTYVSATRGFKSGGTNFAATNSLGMNFKPETLWAYEVGVKSEWLEHRLRLNITGFKYDYKDLQVQSLIAPGVVAIGNAATAGIKGAELEVGAQPVRDVTLDLNYSYLDARYDEFPDASVPSALASYVSGNPRYDASTDTFNAAGMELNSAPKSSLNASAKYQTAMFRGYGSVWTEYHWQAREYFDPSNAAILSQGGYGILNLSLGYEDERGWGVRLLGRNVANKRYWGAMAAPGLVPDGYAGDPRTVALTLTKNW
jgi:iron complex outermembrane receptor protein